MSARRTASSALRSFASGRRSTHQCAAPCASPKSTRCGKRCPGSRRSNPQTGNTRHPRRSVPLLRSSSPRRSRHSRSRGRSSPLSRGPYSSGTEHRQHRPSTSRRRDTRRCRKAARNRARPAQSKRARMFGGPSSRILLRTSDDTPGAACGPDSRFQRLRPRIEHACSRPTVIALRC